MELALFLIPVLFLIFLKEWNIFSSQLTNLSPSGPWRGCLTGQRQHEKGVLALRNVMEVSKKIRRPLWKYCWPFIFPIIMDSIKRSGTNNKKLLQLYAVLSLQWLFILSNVICLLLFSWFSLLSLTLVLSWMLLDHYHHFFCLWCCVSVVIIIITLFAKFWKIIGVIMALHHSLLRR